jgi:hypothetical protein
MSKQPQISLLRMLLQRWMPRVAVAAAVLFVVRALVRDTTLYRTSVFGDLFGFVTFLLGTLTICYYGFKGLRWLKRKLLWRVRRRLIITYLFVGLTPIVLLAGLGFIFGWGLALNMMANNVMLEVNSTQQQARASADALADALIKLPPAIGLCKRGSMSATTCSKPLCRAHNSPCGNGQSRSRKRLTLFRRGRTNLGSFRSHKPSVCRQTRRRNR